MEAGKPGVLPDHSALLADAVSDGANSAWQRRVLVVVPTKGRPRHAARQIGALPADYDVLLLATDVADLPTEASQHPGLRCRIGNYPEPGGTRFATPHPDLAAKRNFGLNLARAEGYNAVVFFDDDIYVTAEQLRAMVSALDRHVIVGRTSVGLADHSMLYRMLSQAGLVKPFVSGNCLAVRADYRAVFPAIYNEDWFFMWSALAHGAVGRIGDVRQVDLGTSAGPQPVRAAAEELGDVLAEGFLRSLHELGQDRSAALKLLNSKEFWSEALNRRFFLYELVQTLSATYPQRDRELIQRNLSSGHHKLAELTAEGLAEAAAELCSISEIDRDIDTGVEKNTASVSGASAEWVRL